MNQTIEQQRAKYALEKVKEFAEKYKRPGHSHPISP